MHTNASKTGTAGPRLAVSGLGISFDGRSNTVDGVNFSVEAGEIFGIVGESGCGKSVTCRAIIGLLPKQADITGHLNICGQDIALTDRHSLTGIRGRICAMIFQDPMSALNPLMSVQSHLTLHLQRNARPAQKHDCANLLHLSGMENPEQFLGAFPHQLSGGQCQRISIAIALAGQPEVLIADEPTTSLDVVLQAQILDTLRDLAQQNDMSIILISHDIGVVGKYCDRAAIMYAGQVVETGPVNTLFHHPRHPYTQGLINALPVPSRRGQMLKPILGEVPKPDARGSGCPFAPRCHLAEAQCHKNHIPTRDFGPSSVRCLLADAAA